MRAYGVACAATQKGAVYSERLEGEREGMEEIEVDRKEEGSEEGEPVSWYAACRG